MLIVRVIWFIIFAMSLVELIMAWNDWFKYRKSKGKTVTGFAGQYCKLTLKCIIPGILSIFGLMVAFL